MQLLMLVREIITVCFEKHTKSINSHCGQDAEIYIAKNVAHIVTSVL
jgi:hypothetical protein